ncbi:hypothetical protein MMC30_004917 [Trapelia coarctata]|nr:hypothetical protein [Trapelia coarctata]
MPDSPMATLALGAQVSVAEAGAAVQAYVEHKRSIHAFLACVTLGVIEGVPVGTLHPEITRMIIRELGPSKSSKTLQRQWRAMLRCCENKCWNYVEPRYDLADHQKNDSLRGVVEDPKHRHGNHLHARRTLLGKLGVILGSGVPEKDTFTSYNKVLERDFEFKIQYTVKNSNGIYDISHGNLIIAAHLLRSLHQQTPVPSTQRHYFGAEAAIVLNSSMLSQVPWDALKTKYSRAMQALDLVASIGHHDWFWDWFWEPISLFDERRGTPLNDWFKQAAGQHGLDLKGDRHPKLILFGAICCDIVRDEEDPPAGNYEAEVVQS